MYKNCSFAFILMFASISIFPSIVSAAPPLPSTGVRLTVSIFGDGTVTSFPTGISCSSTCIGTFDADSNVVLTAVASNGSIFSGWSGVCIGNTSTCTVSMDIVKNATAKFSFVDMVAPVVSAFSIPANSSSRIIHISTLTATDVVGVTGYIITETPSKPSASAIGWTPNVPITFVATGTGNKTLYAWAKDASGNVSQSLSAIVVIAPPVSGTCGANNGRSLAAVPTTNLCVTGVASNMMGLGPWNWMCTGTNGGTTANCSALLGFPVNINFAGTGGGSVSGDVSCPSGPVHLSETFGDGTTVNLFATPNAISTFHGWSGACNTTARNCSITMDRSKTVTATFINAHKAKIGAAGYFSLGAAFSGATNGATIWALDDDLTEVLTVNKILTLVGGYNSTYTGRTGQPTVLTGPLNVRSGRLTVDRLSVK